MRSAHHLPYPPRPTRLIQPAAYALMAAAYARGVNLFDNAEVRGWRGLGRRYARGIRGHSVVRCDDGLHPASTLAFTN